LPCRKADLSDLAQDIVQMFLDFAALDLEDIVAMYQFHRPVRPGGCRSVRFHAYIRLRAAACVPFALRHDPPGQRN
jgi:hypothetical protein